MRTFRNLLLWMARSAVQRPKGLPFRIRRKDKKARRETAGGLKPMAAFGLYTHIQANRRRSILLLIGLFFLVYLLVYAGALIAEVLISGDAPLSS